MYGKWRYVVVAVVLTVVLLFAVTIAVSRFLHTPEQVSERPWFNVTIPSITTGEEVVTEFSSYDELRNYLSKLVYEYRIYPYSYVVETSRAPVPVPPIPPLPTMPAVAETAKAPAKTSAPRFSVTNVQVQGIDELDIVKTDGEFIYICDRGRGLVFIVRAYPVTELKLVSTINVSSYVHTLYSSTTYYTRSTVRGIFISGNKLIIIACTHSIGVLREEGQVGPAKEEIYIPWRVSNTTVLVFDVSDVSSPKLIKYFVISGEYLTSRLLGELLIVLTQHPALERDKLLLPHVCGEVANPKDIHVFKFIARYPVVLNVFMLDLKGLKHRLHSYIGDPTYRIYVSRDSMYILLTKEPVIEIRKVKTMIDELREKLSREANVPIEYIDEAFNKVGIDWGKVNVSSVRVRSVAMYINAFLLTLSRLIEENPRGLRYDIALDKLCDCVNGVLEKYLPKRVSYRTGIVEFRFRYPELELSITAIREIDGKVLDQFAIEEYRDYVFVATTCWNVEYKVRVLKVHRPPPPPGTPVEEEKREYTAIVFEVSRISTDNRFYVLRKNDLGVVACLENLAPGERVYAARLLGKYFFLVTYRRIDPFYAIDISNPEKPKVVGYLKIPGYSEYLHPLSEDWILGIGVEAVDTRPVGLKISLFNVSDPKNIVETSKIVYKYSWSPVLHDYHAILVDYDNNYFVIPVIRRVPSKITGTLALITRYDLKRGELKVVKEVPLEPKREGSSSSSNHPAKKISLPPPIPILTHDVRFIYIGNYLYTIACYRYAVVIKALDIGKDFKYVSELLLPLSTLKVIVKNSVRC
ncbi:MAG: hypothetical protein DRJ40_01350 [Thermoprotei archaeon]|nr:MAG: hypothetical protein DRJ40_01350 [Thermoprotei archaeon]